MTPQSIEKKIRRSGILISAGLAVQLATMAWAHPLSFMTFLLIGSPLVLAGAVFYLYSLVSADR